MALFKSAAVTNLETLPPVVIHRKNNELKVRFDSIALPTTALDNADDSFVLCPLPSNAVVLNVSVKNDVLDGVADLAANIGVAFSGQGGSQKRLGNTVGTVIDADAFASAVTTFQTATLVWTELTNEAGDIADIGQELWEYGSLTEDPGGLLYILVDLTVAAATPTAGDLIVKVEYL